MNLLFVFAFSFLESMLHVWFQPLFDWQLICRTHLMGNCQTARNTNCYIYVCIVCMYCYVVAYVLNIIEQRRVNVFAWMFECLFWIEQGMTKMFSFVFYLRIVPKIRYLGLYFYRIHCCKLNKNVQSWQFLENYWSQL